MARIDGIKAATHVQKLVGQGMPKTAIARRAKAHRRIVWKLASARPDDPPVIIAHETERRLLAVKFDPALSPRGRYAAEDQTMIRALNWQGWSDRAIAAGSGIDEGTVGRIAGGQESVLYDTHRRIKRFYASHWAFYGGDSHARDRAWRRGYDPPKEWDGSPVPHGTMGAYSRGCHCADCRTANAKRKAMRELQDLRGIRPDVTDAEPARLHAQGLIAQGMPLAAIARKADVSHEYMVRLVYGRPGHPQTQTIPCDRDRRIRYVKFDPAYMETGRRHPAGTERRIKGLIWMRWEIEDIVAGTGVVRDRISRLINGKAVWVSEDVYLKVKKFYDANWHRDGGSEAARNRAIRERFAPPGAWSEDNIDDPKAKPRGVDERIYREAAS